MARKVPKRDYGQAKGGYSPFKKAAPVKVKTICSTCGGAGAYDAYDRVKGAWFTYYCNNC
jgi:hypothetical protein